VIDLHLHTTASDGSLTAQELVEAVIAHGITTMAVTDHDTTAAIEPARRAAAAAGLTFVTGIEITAVHDGRDVHVLGYFIDPQDAELAAFLTEQRLDRRRRVLEMAERLDRLGYPISLESSLQPDGSSGRSFGRPLVADALVRAGWATDMTDAFDRLIGHGRPAFIERRGASPEGVIERIAGAGGLASIAHPGKLELDDQIPAWASAGLTALEVFHPDHTDEDVTRYRELASRLDLVVTGGSDYHGPGSRRAPSFGHTHLPMDAFVALAARAAAVRRS
jgi:predicted metal-dependent phosphoesterase TrpH